MKGLMNIQSFITNDNDGEIDIVWTLAWNCVNSFYFWGWNIKFWNKRPSLINASLINAPPFRAQIFNKRPGRLLE